MLVNIFLLATVHNTHITIMMVTGFKAFFLMFEEVNNTLYKSKNVEQEFSYINHFLALVHEFECVSRTKGVLPHVFCMCVCHSFILIQLNPYVELSAYAKHFIFPPFRLFIP